MQPARVQKIHAQIKNLIENFDSFLNTYCDQPPFKRYGQLEYHQTTILMRKRLGSALKAIKNDDFLESLYKTLRAWGIGLRGAILVPYPEFKRAIQNKAKLISDLEEFRIDDIQINPQQLSNSLWGLMDSLEIVENNAKLVASSKALHHILPDLIVPIDRAYTRRFFGWHGPEFQYNQKKFLSLAFESFTIIARATNPKKYVGIGWNTSQTKVLDNAIVGFMLVNPRPNL